MSGVATRSTANGPAEAFWDLQLWLSVVAATGGPVGAILVVVGFFAVLVAGFGHTELGGAWALPLLLALPAGGLLLLFAPFVAARLSRQRRPMLAGAIAEASALAAFFVVTAAFGVVSATVLAFGLAAGISIAYQHRAEVVARGAILTGLTGPLAAQPLAQANAR